MIAVDDEVIPVGHQVEYFVKLAPPASRKWLAQFDGFWVEPPGPGQLPSGEFLLWDDQCLLTQLGPTACWLRLPRIKYSWLIAEHPPAVANIERFEQLLTRSIPGVPWVRLDELVREEWEASVGHSWQEDADPVGSLQSWLPAFGHSPNYFRILAAEGQGR